jgi:GTP:adenosylcobinamide-phosphate guanylyltransferase
VAESVKYTAVLLAGSRPGRDEFAYQFGTDMKALIAVGGEPMVRRPVRALLGSASVSKVIVLGQAPERLAAVIPKDERVLFGESLGTIAETMLQLLDDQGLGWPLLVTTADHALLTSSMVDEICEAAGSSDVAVGVVRRASLLRRLPGTERTWLKFRGGAYTGANLFALSSPKVRPAIELWRSVEQDRKKAWRVIALLGPGVLIAAALRLVSIDEVLARLGRRLGLRVKAVRLSNPLAGVDVDKPADHTLVEAILAGRA